MKPRFQKSVAVGLLFGCLWGMPLSAKPASAASQSTEPLPYERSEFPEGVNELRRFEQIFIGAFPLGILFSQLLGGLGLFIDDALYNDGSSSFKLGSENYRVDDKVRIIGAGVGLGFGIALIDMILYQTRKKKADHSYQKKRVLSVPGSEEEAEGESNSVDRVSDSTEIERLPGLSAPVPVDDASAADTGAFSDSLSAPSADG